MIWITHDLGVVAGLADRVMVMYAGYIVEEAPVVDLYENPRHPYTLALLAALPRVDRRREHHLKSIPGAPPNLLVEPRGLSICAALRVCFRTLYRRNARRSLSPGTDTSPPAGWIQPPDILARHG